VQKTRVQILSKLEELIRNGHLKTYSQRLYDQLQAFVWNGNKPMASKDSYDDLIMSLAIGCWLVEGGTTVNQHQVAMAYAMLAATGKNSRDQSQMPGNIQSAQPLVNPSIRGFNPHLVHRPQNPSTSSVRSRDHSDFSWLFR
jgi:membrane carboxypeptidase/penicillin-binding protein PbpC